MAYENLLMLISVHGVVFSPTRLFIVLQLGRVGGVPALGRELN